MSTYTSALDKDAYELLHAHKDATGIPIKRLVSDAVRKVYGKPKPRRSRRRKHEGGS